MKSVVGTMPDRPPPGWYVVDVMKVTARKWDWSALMIDVSIDDFVSRRKHNARQRFFRIPGKHRNRDAALVALDSLMAIRH